MIPLITALPADPPSTADPANFDARGDALLGALPTMVTEENAAIAAMNAAITQMNLDIAAIATAATLAADAAGMLGSSSSTLTVNAGDKNIVLSGAKPNLMTVDRQVVLILKSDPTIRMFGNIDGTPTPTSTTAQVVVTSGGVSGAGTFSGWDVMAASFFAAAATAAEVLAAVSDAAPMTPKSLKDALAPYALTDGATVTPSGLNGLDFSWTIGGNRTLGALTNTYPGARGQIAITQDGTGSRILAWSSVYRRRGGLPVLSTAAAAVDYLNYTVKAVDVSGTATLVIVTFDKAPTTS